MKKMPDNYIQNHWLPATFTLTMPPGIQERLDAFVNRKASDTNRVVKRKPRKPSMTHATLEGRSNQQSTQPPLPTSTPPACLTGDTVKQMREAKGWTQAYLASLVGKSVTWIKLIESGRRRIQDADQLTLRQVLGLTS
jgi:ribosome-binding protein aMBF1 (putative translation factor)